MVIGQCYFTVTLKLKRRFVYALKAGRIYSHQTVDSDFFTLHFFFSLGFGETWLSI